MIIKVKKKKIKLRNQKLRRSEIEEITCPKASKQFKQITNKIKHTYN